MATQGVRGNLELVEKCLCGDSRAWDSLLAAAGRLAEHLFRDRGDVAGYAPDDVASEVIARLLANDCARLRAYRGQSSLEAWLAPIVRHTLVDLLRKAWAREIATDTCQDAPLGEGYCGPVHDVELLALARASLEALPRPWRQVIELRVLGGLGFREIAARLGITPAAARQRFRRALLRARCAEAGTRTTRNA